MLSRDYFLIISFLSLQIPNAPYYPLTGPSSLSLNLQKKEKIDEYKLTATMDYGKFTLVTETVPPTERGVSFTAEKTANALNIDFKSPWKTAKFTGEIFFQHTKKSFIIYRLFARSRRKSRASCTGEEKADRFSKCRQ